MHGDNWMIFQSSFFQHCIVALGAHVVYAKGHGAQSRIRWLVRALNEFVESFELLESILYIAAYISFRKRENAIKRCSEAIQRLWPTKPYCIHHIGFPCNPARPPAIPP